MDGLLGFTQPRLATPPLRELTPETSYGFAVIDFAREIDRPLLPWQEVAVIRGGELLPDGRPRFRILLLVVARQNGKTELPVILSMFWQFREKRPLTVGTSTQLVYAKESWRKAVNLVGRTAILDDQHAPGRKWYRSVNGEIESETYAGCRYKIAAANSEGGRSLSIDRAIVDELRQHHTYEAWDAIEPACSPWDTQIWALSNAGNHRSVVLNDLQDAARAFIETGDGDERLGLLEWSAADGSDPEDVDALLQANPRAGRGPGTLDLDVLIAKGKLAKARGGEKLTGFQTESMCMRVKALNPAIEPASWTACLDPGIISPADRPVLAIDVDRNGLHATIAVAAILEDFRVRVETVAEFTGPRAASDLERALPDWTARTGASVVGWLPGGPAAATASRLADRRKLGVRGWPPRGVTVAEIRGEVPAICMGLAKEVAAHDVAHSGQEMLDAQIGAAEKGWRGNVWEFIRKDENGIPRNTDAVYAVAAAVHLARTSPRRRRATKMQAVTI